MSDYQTIEGVDGITPVGAILSMGRKGTEGRRGVVERDRFHLVAPRAVNDVRPHLAAFTRFNTAVPEARQSVLGNLVFARREECFQYSLRNFVAPGGRRHPDRRPFCVGDGTQATRWMGTVEEPDNFQTIRCPNDRCEFRQGTPAACKPWMRFRFRLRWPETAKPEWRGMPRLLAQFESTSWNTVKLFVGLFDYVEQMAKDIGIVPIFFGLPVVLSLTFQTKPSKQQKFPVVVPNLDDVDPIEWFTKQQTLLAQLRDREQITLAQSEVPERPMLIHQAYEELEMPGPLSQQEE